VGAKKATKWVNKEVPKVTRVAREATVGTRVPRVPREASSLQLKPEDKTWEIKEVVVADRIWETEVEIVSDCKLYPQYA
jgi:hypothetical protein